MPDSEDDSPSPTQAINDTLQFQTVDHSKEHAEPMELSLPNSPTHDVIDRADLNHGESTESMEDLLFPESTAPNDAYDNVSRSLSEVPESTAFSDSDELLGSNITRTPSVELQQTSMRSESSDSHLSAPSQQPEVRPVLSEFASSLYKQPANTILRSYPLRERTFQQRQPYTADKQHHARLIGSRGISVKPILSGENARGDDLAIVEQDEEDYSDYEEPTPRHRTREGSPTAQDTIAEPAPWHLYDLDDDDLPTLDELRQQYSRPKATYSAKDRAKAKADRHGQLLPLVKITPALSIRERRKLERFTMQSVELLDEVDAPPSFIPQQPRPRSKPKSRSRKTDKEAFDAGDPLAPRMSSSEPFGSDHDLVEEPNATQELSDAPEEDGTPRTKKPKRPRQHVLPMSFFKKNLLPDDAADLKSMSARTARSHTPDRNQRAQSKHPQLAHHAKRRIALATQGVALDDFMAQLAQEASESEDETNTRDDPSAHDMNDDFLDQETHRSTAWRSSVKNYAVVSQRVS